MRAGVIATTMMMIVTLGCAPDQPPPCITVDLECDASYEPTFDNVYAMTLAEGCGSTKTSCHSAAGRKGDMSFETAQVAHAALLDGRVMPGDPGCSELIVRTSSPGTDYQMPVGAALSKPEQCALIKWVAAGAPGPGEPLPMTFGVRR